MLKLTLDLLLAVDRVAVDAGQRILQIYETDFSVAKKSDHSPLTEADLAAHHAIVAALPDLLDDVPVLSEESSQTPYEVRRQWSRYWLVDPLDGTREFVKRNGDFTVNIALIDENRPVLGVVHVPVSGKSYFAARGLGAHKRCPGGKPTAIRTRTGRRDALIVAGSRSHGNEQTQAFIQRLQPAEVRGIGSSLKFCLVAEGEADLYPRFGPTSEWDTAAAQCVLEEAGGLVTDLTSKPLEYNRKESLLNPFFLALGDPDIDWSEFL